MSDVSENRLTLSRKNFLLASATLAVGATLMSPATASNKAAPMSADAALAKLKAGNETFVRYMSQTRQQTIPERAALARGQAPFAAILSCADSRTTPEIIFNQGLGDLFVVRVAGNVVTSTEKGSLEYAAAELKSPVIVVLGHSSCGAVKAAIELLEGETFPADIQTLATIIKPAAQAAKGQSGDWTTNAIKSNVKQSVRNLQATPLLAKMASSGSLKIVGAYYDLKSGRVTFLS